jgi:uncharacterized protein YjbI with pentapeptide repeats
METVTLQTLFEDKETLEHFAKTFNLKIEDFETEDDKNYLNERFPLNKVKQVKSLFQLRILKGWLFCNFWDIKVEPLGKLYLNNLNLDDLGFIERDLQNADFSNSTLVRAYFRSANLENANFQNANLTNAFLMKANLKNANFDGAILAKIQDSGAIY